MVPCCQAHLLQEAGEVSSGPAPILKPFPVPSLGSSRELSRATHSVRAEQGL